MKTKIQNWEELARLIQFIGDSENTSLSAEELEDLEINANADTDLDNYRTLFGKLAIGDKFLSATGLGVWTKTSDEYATCEYFRNNYVLGDTWKPNNIVWVIGEVEKANLSSEEHEIQQQKDAAYKEYLESSGFYLS